MLPGKKISFDEVFRALWRRRWLVVLPAVVGLVGAVDVARRIPPEYRSETLIMVVPQRVPTSYVMPTVTATVADRLSSISDLILSRSRLERIITDLNLYAEERATTTMEQVVHRMRGQVQVRLERNQASFRVSYAHRDAALAQKVTARLASLFIEENLRERENLADGTSEFLESQLEEAKRRLVEHEKKLEDYRRRHTGELPSQLQGNLQAVQNAHMMLRTVGESMNRARERRLLIERQLADAEAAPAAEIQNAAGPEAEATLPAARQLEAAQARLNLFRLRYKPDHPDVRALERSIAELDVKVREEAARTGNADPAELLSPSEAARQRRIRELNAEIALIDRQLAANQAEEARLTGVIADYQARISAAPSRESELVELTRDYSTLQGLYGSLLQKREDSKLAANLERRQIGEQFRVLDAASRPGSPANQKVRLGVIAGGAAGGLLLSLALIALIELRDSSIRREEDVTRLLTLPVLATVPLMTSDVERRRLWYRTLTADLLGVTVVLGAAAALIVWRLQP